MKRSIIRKLVVGISLVASMGAYGFLNYASYAQLPDANQAKTLTEYEEKREQPTLLLPDVQFVKKIADAARRLLPAS